MHFVPGIWKTYYPSVLDSFSMIKSNVGERGFILAQSLGYSQPFILWKSQGRTVRGRVLLYLQSRHSS